jgi:carbonic anhydrase
VRELLCGNQAWARHYIDCDLKISPSKNTVILTCSDAAITEEIFGPGSKVGKYVWIRNAGGLWDERSGAIAQVLLDADELLILHHENCIQRRYYSQELATYLQEVSGISVENWFGDFTVSQVDALATAAKAMDSPHFPRKLNIVVAVYDDKTGKINVVPQPSYIISKPFKVVRKEVSQLLLGSLLDYKDKDIKYTQVQCKEKRNASGVAPTKCEYQTAPRSVKPRILPPHFPCPPKKCGYKCGLPDDKCKCGYVKKDCKCPDKKDSHKRRDYHHGYLSPGEYQSDHSDRGSDHSDRGSDHSDRGSDFGY